MDLTRYSVPVNLGIASVKAAMVLWFFMHMRDEGVFLRGVVVLGIFTLTAIIGLTYSDTWYR
jgi:cytochrome c oxidase subunit 4